MPAAPGAQSSGSLDAPDFAEEDLDLCKCHRGGGGGDPYLAAVEGAGEREEGAVASSRVCGVGAASMEERQRRRAGR